ncbi:MAG: TetR/AcrR family transcriptional regulator [Acidimicrobiales bacterium]|jgi:AcrR family transcriptional regulator|nr:TetR/AcrR family transcriptional regulator [Acidimicrobiales bacterium]
MELMMVSGRQTAEERRTAVLAAAISEFARSGYAGTSTEAIAARAGISQPYLFRLFGTKKDLFVATYDLVGDRIIRELTLAGEGLEGEDALVAMGAAYVELMQDPELLQVQLHGFAAAPGDPDIARSCRRTFEVLQGMIRDRNHISDDELRNFFATGMLINVMAAIDLLSISDPWAQNLCPAPEKAQALKAVTQALEAQHRADEATNAEVPA